MPDRRSLVLIAHNLRSTHNVGSLLRTADGLGIDKVWLTGYTPYPRLKTDDPRLPHLADKIAHQINKTALGAEQSVDWQHTDDIGKLIQNLKDADFTIAGLEQAVGSISLQDYQPPTKLGLIVGREVEGIEANVLALCDQIIEIPMNGQKESFNVAVAASIALYHCRYYMRLML